MIFCCNFATANEKRTRERNENNDKDATGKTMKGNMSFPSIQIKGRHQLSERARSSGVKDIQFVEKIGNYISNSGEFDPGSG